MRPANSGCTLTHIDELWLALEPRLVLASPDGAELTLNGAVSELQDAYGPRSVASDSAGNFVAVWESYNQDSALS